MGPRCGHQIIEVQSPSGADGPPFLEELCGHRASVMPLGVWTLGAQRHSGAPSHLLRSFFSAEGTC